MMDVFYIAGGANSVEGLESAISYGLYNGHCISG